MSIVSYDPGAVNFAYSVIKTNKLKVKVVKNGILENTIRNLTIKLNKQVTKFQTEIDSLESIKNNNLVVLERFQGRGLKGLTGELTSIMIGATLYHYSHKSKVPLRLVTASTWKNAVNRVFDLKMFYRRCGATPHQIDAVLIGIYGLYKQQEVTPYKKYHDYSELKQLMIDIENSSATKLTKRRESK